MKKFLKRISIASKGLRYKLMIAFSLMSIIPLLVCVYLAANFLLIDSSSLTGVRIVVLLSITIALLGLLLAKRIVEPIINLALESKIIAAGELGHKIQVDREDEIGDLSNSINSITQKIRDYMLELQTRSKETREANLDIQKKVLTLSWLLQIGDMIASSERLEKVMNVIAEKISDINEGSLTIIFSVKPGIAGMAPMAWFNVNKRPIRDLSFNKVGNYLGTLSKERKITKTDSTSKPNGPVKVVCDILKLKNCLIIPVSSQGAGIGLIITGNSEAGFAFKEDDIELVKVLSKQLGIAVENKILAEKSKEFSVRDDLTGLFNENYIKEKLDEEIRRAAFYQRPCSLLLFNIDNFKKFRDRHGELVTEDALKKIAAVLKRNATEIGRVARMGGDGFAIVLPEKNKKEATKIAEEIRKTIETAGVRGIKKGELSLTISGSVSENPIDGTSAGELFGKAAAAMKRAKLEGKNRIGT